MYGGFAAVDADLYATNTVALQHLGAFARYEQCVRLQADVKLQPPGYR